MVIKVTKTEAILLTFVSFRGGMGEFEKEYQKKQGTDQPQIAQINADSKFEKKAVAKNKSFFEKISRR